MKQPAPVYRRVAGHRRRHIWLSSNIHGCLEQLRRKLWHCCFDPWQDLLILVGDVTDRGPQSLRCLQLLRQHWVYTVKGSHGQMAMDALASQQMSLWLMNDGDWFIALTDNQQKQAKTTLEKCQHLPFIPKVHSRTGKHVIAHTNYPDDVYEWQKDVDLYQVLWSRSQLDECQKRQGVIGADRFWFDHTSLRHRMDIDNLHYIDTGAVFGGGLTLVQLQQLRIAVLLCRSLETIYKTLNRKTTTLADPLIAHRMETLLFRVVDTHNNTFTAATRVANKKYQREHFIPEVWCRTVKFRRDFTTGGQPGQIAHYADKFFSDQARRII